MIYQAKQIMAGQDDEKINGDEVVADEEIDPTEDGQNDTDNANIREEYDFLDSKLDELNTALDFLEQKNNDIHEKLKELLQANIEIRQELKNEKVTLSADK